MKIITIIILLAFFLIFSVSTQLAAASQEQVFDISGGKILIGSAYYILPVATCYPPIDGTTCGSVGGIALLNSTRSGNGPNCPIDVVAVDMYGGLPVIFNAMTRREPVVNISRDVNIHFYAETSCLQSTVWKLDDFDPSTGKWFVTTGGSLGSPGKKTIRNWFKVEEYDGDYKIVHCPCPSVYKSKHCQCGHVGVYEDENDNKRLALTDVPLKVRFQHA